MMVTFHKIWTTYPNPNFPNCNCRTMPRCPRRRPKTDPPTHGSSEYSQAFAFSVLKHRPRLRNPNPGWISRNKSNILPSQLERRSQTAQQRRWPWQDRAIRSEIFEDQRVTVSDTNPTSKDVNNNPETRPAPTNPRVRWPWQRGAQTSNIIFLFDRQSVEVENAMPPPRSKPKWSWQERAMKSKIFDQPEEKQPTPKNYQWDQRKTTSLFGPEAGDSQIPDASAVSESQRRAKGNKSWPWQEKALQGSNIFEASEPQQLHGIKYPWDQRQSSFDEKSYTNKFEAETRYQQDYLKKTDVKAMAPAGIRCYGSLADTSIFGVKNREPAPKSKSVDDSNLGILFSAEKDATSTSEKEMHTSPPISGRKPSITVLQDVKKFNDMSSVFTNLDMAETKIKQEVEKPIAKIRVANDTFPENGLRVIHLD